MQCPNCQKDCKDKTICPACKIDTVLYAGTVRLSDKLYNKGLSKLNNGDLTHGIEILNRSVSVNKNNIPARNLLGLALFEIGYVGDAFKHWVISQSLQKQDNPATGYLEEARKNSRTLETLNDAAAKYNQALLYIKQKSDDLAIIQLKRAVELNPRFINALNLLALCHLIQNNREKAVAAVERVLAIDIQNTIALNYMSIINPGRARHDTRRGDSGRTGRKSFTKAPQTSYRAIAVQEKKVRTFRFDIILALVIGAVCTFAVMYILFYPAIDRQHENQLQVYRNRLSEADAAREADAEMHDEALQEIQAGVLLQDEEIQAWEARYDLADRTIRFHQADNLFRDGQFLETIERLDNIDMTGLPRDLIDRAEFIREDAYPRLGTQFVNEGINAFNTGDYYKALVDLEQALRFMSPTAARRAEFLFALGSLYYRDEARHSEARVILEELSTHFPNHAPIRTRAMLEGLTDED
ncbi:MAG: hypothetical protein FWC77_01730 [Defluviitaleaceae bacterium]|nr:hypothetical protein [Defluviitaleaceae bacterium]